MIKWSSVQHSIEVMLFLFWLAVFIVKQREVQVISFIVKVGTGSERNISLSNGFQDSKNRGTSTSTSDLTNVHSVL